ncbi:MotA/TolQ/ExbB proton channel family protein [Phormidium sp. FACHB-1136]|uniref:MotA/TolQ/ExbB proton channel family protein n=1 Tax=Phormidium sp. FACHB-1136 TaxID=2692848 RepID=UPI0016860D64|nr:MotA/TolQ/ExbB proton channel family protein [Phormidium sp. FACHB-1136]MBD2425464.1 MotA/TolQ/ExbB proton channel family protein [Phormidium sp. FACHB-1136]
MGTIFAAGGIVMWPLLGFSILAIALIVERSLFWFRINRRQRPVMQDILRTYRQAPVDVYPKLRQNVNLPTARIFLEALDIEGASPKQFHLALASAMQAELPHLRRFSTVFATIISVAPLLGLLGTILGLIQSFAALQLGDLSTNTGAVTGGISEALVSTAAGLVVAIGTLIFANLFRGLYKRQVALIQEYGGQLEILYETHYERQHSLQEASLMR